MCKQQVATHHEETTAVRLRLQQLCIYVGFKSKASSALKFIRMNVSYDNTEARQKYESAR